MSNELSPAQAPAKPPVVIWFKIYCGFLCVLYLATAAVSLVFFLADPADLGMSTLEARLLGGVLLLMGLGLFLACLLPLLLSPRPWVWTYDLVLICLGMTSPCFLPACIPLLVFWLKPATKEYFGKS
jgi:hypothetical protein